MKKALGLLEVQGLASAVFISDVMIKSASVELVGVEQAKGGGWMTIKVVGDVGAVKASVEAGEAQSKQNGSFIAAKVIPRPGEGIADFFLAEDKNFQVKPVAAKENEVVSKQPAEEKKELVEKVEQPATTSVGLEPAVVKPAVQHQQNASEKNNTVNKKPPVKGGRK